MSTAFWTNSLIFYQLVLRMIDMHWNIGNFVQAGMGYSCLAGEDSAYHVNVLYYTRLTGSDAL